MSRRAVNQTTVISKLTDCHSNGISLNGSLRLNQEARRLVEEVRKQRSCLTRRKKSLATNLVSQALKMSLERQDQALLPALGLIGLPARLNESLLRMLPLNRNRRAGSTR